MCRSTRWPWASCPRSGSARPCGGRGPSGGWSSGRCSSRAGPGAGRPARSRWAAARGGTPGIGPAGRGERSGVALSGRWADHGPRSTAQLHTPAVPLTSCPPGPAWVSSPVKRSTRLGGDQTSTCANDAGSTPGSGRSPGGGPCDHSSILAWRTPQTEAGGCSPWGRKESDTTEASWKAHT